MSTAKHRIYLASSWRNALQPSVLAALREAGHEVYDFRNPAPGDTGFGWRQIGDRSTWTAAHFANYVLDHPVAEHGFSLDMNALKACTACVLLLPCGRSAHLELDDLRKNAERCIKPRAKKAPRAETPVVRCKGCNGILSFPPLCAECEGNG